MINMIAIAQSSPGAIAVNTSILLGYRLAGIAGAIISTLGTVLPPLNNNNCNFRFFTVNLRTTGC